MRVFARRFAQRVTPPGLPHRVEPGDDARFVVEFHR